MTLKSTIIWNSILPAFAKKHGSFEHAHQLFEKIPEPNTVSYNIMLACHWHHFGIHNARGFFDRMPFRDTASWNTMISGYAQVGLMDEARRLFAAMPEKNCHVESDGVWICGLRRYRCCCGVFLCCTYEECDYMDCHDYWGRGCVKAFQDNVGNG
ncbi:pentatricopeptide repeat-containing protein mitochondrial-like, partial [Trifolium medium]|nr:pentatricopeptide repeat-containing protein mitochondrial-like [Trifolium medium]